MNIISKTFYNITRNYAKRFLTGNLGKVVEDEEKLTCYVKKNKIRSRNYCYTIACFGITRNLKKFYEIYKLNKSICYIIDDIDFRNHKVNIFGYGGCEIIIKDCNFEYGSFIHVDGKCTVEDTTITECNSLLIESKNLIIKNMDIENQFSLANSDLKIKISATDNLEIINSNIGKENNRTEVGLYANNIKIIDSKISGDYIKCNSKNINVDNSSTLISDNKVELKTDNFNSINIKSPLVLLNDEKISNEKDSIKIEKVTNPLLLNRIELIKILKFIKEKCECINVKETQKYQEYLNNKSINKILRK